MQPDIALGTFMQISPISFSPSCFPESQSLIFFLKEGTENENKYHLYHLLKQVSSALVKIYIEK